MGIINVLSPQMANLIAAGEVVERPGSVVKELIENAVDAGASRIEIDIRNGGVAYIRITDDGCGIDPEDVPTAFLRHATSKLREPSDLTKIATMGFRGEALAAISAVAKVDLFTKTENQVSGVHITCEGGVLGQPEETGCPKGTSIVVRDLFYNTPARMKFLKKDATESSYCESAVVSAALAHPDISFRLTKDGRESFFTTGGGDLLQVIAALSGKETAGELLPVKGSFPETEISGFVSPVGLTRSSRSMQYFLVNGRPVRGKILTAAVDAAYKGRIMPGRYPVCFLTIDLPYSAVDVNVHPAKLEVKFAREKDVFSAIHNTITMALDEAANGFQSFRRPEQKRPAVPQEDNLTGFQQQLVVERTEDGHLVMPEPAGAKREPLASPSAAAVYKTPADADKKQPDPFDDLDDSLFRINKLELVPPKLPDAPAPKAAETKKQEERPAETPEHVTVLGQVFDTYVIAQQGDCMWMIDKHAAHERLLFNKLVETVGDMDRQTLLSPLPVPLTAPEKQACLDNLALLERSGFELTDFGLAGLSVRAAPTYLEQEDVPFVLTEMARKLQEGGRPETEVLHDLLASISCKAAVKGGSYSSPQELETLAREVLSRPDVKNCPHGRPVAVSMTRYQMEKQFKRVL